MKACSCCGVKKDYSGFHKRNSGSPDGYFRKCKACRKKEAANRYANNREDIAKSARRWAEANPELRKAADKRWRQNNRDKCAKYRKDWKARNPEKYSQSIANRPKDKAVQATLRWQKKHPEKAAHLAALRRAKTKRAMPGWANIDLIREMYKNRPEGYHVDHIVPLSGKIVCGLHCEDNLQYLPAIENIAKNNQLVEEYCYG